MSAQIIVPDLGESVLEATVGHWRKKEGDRVSAGEVLVGLETDKVDLEVAAEHEGVLARIERKEGEDVHIGDVLGLIEEAAPGVQPANGASAAQQAPPPAAAPPEQAAVASGPAAAPGDNSRATQKAAPSVAKTSTAAGAASSPDASPVPVEAHRPTAQEFSTPSARRFAREQGVDLARVPVAGAAARVTREDVQKFASSPGNSASQPAPAPPSAPAGPQVVPSQREERVRMSRRRLTIAQRLVEAQRVGALLTTFNEIDMGAVMELRQRQKETFKERYGTSLGITSFFVKASIAALKQFPRLNAEIQSDEMVLKRYYDIGVAVGAEEGLVVPVLRDADRMSFAEIEIAVKDYARKAREGSLALADLRGGTFSVTNGGVFGSLLSTPILNPPQSGILGLHKIEERPVAVRGEIKIRPMMYVALTYDHRIVDGLEAVQFLVRVKGLVEDPGTLLLES